MGCVSSSAAKPAASAQGSGGGNDPSDKRLLDEYSVGQTLGEGAFGVVSVCKKRSTGEEFAVKMVDKVETPVEAIKKEADMLQSMDHPNIVKFHGVYNERCFVCIVMNKLDGGDLVEGLQRHLKERGQINCHDVVHVAMQMASSIAYLHKRNVVHRDIKGDNYLMDRKNMTDRHCRIVLTDFGTACHATPTERLSSGVGTKIFWPPEFFDRDYGHKVDVWAMGVIMYGLVSGRFPFRDETDVRNKEVRIPKRVHPVCEEYIRRMLDKVEKTRISSQEAINHAWVAGKGVNVVDVDISSKGNEQDTSETGEGMAESGVNDGVKERRQELIKRLHKEAEIGKGGSSKAKQLQNHKHKKFTVADKIVQGGKAMYEWWPPAQVKQANLMELEGKSPAPKDSASDVAMFKKTLVDHNIDPNLFGVGEAKEIGQLAKEVETGASRLMLDAEKHKKLVRVVDIVVLKLRPTSGADRLLIEFKERFPDGRERSTVRLPGTKKEPHENTRQTAERILRTMLDMDPAMVQLDFSNVERQEEEKDSPSFPGVTTIYRRELVDCIVSTGDTKLLNQVGLPDRREWKASDASGNTKFFTWMTDQEANTKVNLKGQNSQISTLVRAPIGLDEEALTDHLKALRVDVTKFGVNGAKTLKEFSTELVKGETRLLQVEGGQILVITEVVMMVLQKQDTKEVLVQTSQLWPDGKQSDVPRVPGAKRRPDENQFLCARRILRRQLEIDENAVILSQDVGYIEEDRASNAYPGLKTVYRKRVITGEVVPGL
eukprot:TRINITY_DN87279_c0_g1_i1.p1 TRINITY_DN87279_c0_g1~~TRINITY_DN87279_c0_g1_i1.p1  ORF type:complete len:771 (+),score=157.91 TRINITY_DN87279_c0_g1_i1:64-2376(+)